MFEFSINDERTVVYTASETSLLTDKNGKLIFDKNSEPIAQLISSTVETGNVVALKFN